jgi:hypothetical protein
MILTSWRASGFTLTRAPVLFPRFRFVTPSTVYSCWLNRVPLTLNWPTTFCTVEVVIVVPATTPGMVLKRSVMFRPFRARSRSCVLVTRSERSADSDWICRRPRGASTVSVSATLPTSRTRSPRFMREAVGRMTLLRSIFLNPASSALTV